MPETYEAKNEVEHKTIGKFMLCEHKSLKDFVNLARTTYQKHKKAKGEGFFYIKNSSDNKCSREYRLFGLSNLFTTFGPYVGEFTYKFPKPGHGFTTSRNILSDILAELCAPSAWDQTRINILKPYAGERVLSTEQHNVFIQATFLQGLINKLNQTIKEKEALILIVRLLSQFEQRCEKIQGLTDKPANEIKEEVEILKNYFREIVKKNAALQLELNLKSSEISEAFEELLENISKKDSSNGTALMTQQLEKIKDILISKGVIAIITEKLKISSESHHLVSRIPLVGMLAKKGIATDLLNKIKILAKEGGFYQTQINEINAILNSYSKDRMQIVPIEKRTASMDNLGLKLQTNGYAENQQQITRTMDVQRVKENVESKSFRLLWDLDVMSDEVLLLVEATLFFYKTHCREFNKLKEKAEFKLNDEFKEEGLKFNPKFTDKAYSDLVENFDSSEYSLKLLCHVPSKDEEKQQDSESILLYKKEEIYSVRIKDSAGCSESYKLSCFPSNKMYTASNIEGKFPWKKAKDNGKVAFEYKAGFTHWIISDYEHISDKEKANKFLKTYFNAFKGQDELEKLCRHVVEEVRERLHKHVLSSFPGISDGAFLSNLFETTYSALHREEHDVTRQTGISEMINPLIQDCEEKGGGDAFIKPDLGNIFTCGNWMREKMSCVNVKRDNATRELIDNIMNESSQYEQREKARLRAELERAQESKEESRDDENIESSLVKTKKHDGLQAELQSTLRGQFSSSRTAKKRVLIPKTEESSDSDRVSLLEAISERQEQAEYVGQDTDAEVKSDETREVAAGFVKNVNSKKQTFSKAFISTLSSVTSRLRHQPAAASSSADEKHEQLKKENATLKEEIATQKQASLKQQETLNKEIQTLGEHLSEKQGEYKSSKEESMQLHEANELLKEENGRMEERLSGLENKAQELDKMMEKQQRIEELSPMKTQLVNFTFKVIHALSNRTTGQGTDKRNRLEKLRSKILGTTFETKGQVEHAFRQFMWLICQRNHLGFSKTTSSGEAAKKLLNDADYKILKEAMFEDKKGQAITCQDIWDFLIPEPGEKAGKALSSSQYFSSKNNRSAVFSFFESKEDEEKEDEEKEEKENPFGTDITEVLLGKYEIASNKFS